MRIIKDRLRSLTYRLGLLGALHYWRNRKTLTVFMFHRVLPVASAAYAAAEKEFAFSIEGFSRCLDFIAKHYRVISLDELAGDVAGLGRKPLALITFDDGWQDTLVHALPVLKEHGLPGVVFLSTEAILDATDRWWQDLLVEIVSDEGRCVQLLEVMGVVPENHGAMNRLHWLSAKLAELPIAERLQILQRISPGENLGRQMIKPENLSDFSPVMAIGGHGHTHAPLTKLRDPGEDLRTCHRYLSDKLGKVSALSFPHGDLDATTELLARACGFDLIFSSESKINSIERVDPRNVVFGRLHVPENQWTCDDQGIVSHAKLATYVFFRDIS